MRVIDAYCSIGPWSYRDRIQPSDPAETLEIMDYCGVDFALAFSNLAHTSSWSVEANARVAEAARKHPRFIPAFVLTSRPYDDSRQVDDYLPEMRACGARGAWLWPQNNRQGHGLWKWTTAPLFEFCVAHRLPLFLSIEVTTPDRVDEICRDFPALTLVLVGLPYSADVWLFPLLRSHSRLHVCCGQAYVPPLGPQRFVRHFGPDRLIFGSGLPQFGPGGLIGHVMYADIPDSAKESILGGNLERLMGEVRL